MQWTHISGNEGPRVSCGSFTRPRSSSRRPAVWRHRRQRQLCRLTGGAPQYHPGIGSGSAGRSGRGSPTSPTGRPVGTTADRIRLGLGLVTGNSPGFQHIEPATGRSRTVRAGRTRTAGAGRTVTGRAAGHAAGHAASGPAGSGTPGTRLRGPDDGRPPGEPTAEPSGEPARRLDDLTRERTGTGSGRPRADRGPSHRATGTSPTRLTARPLHIRSPDSTGQIPALPPRSFTCASCTR